MWISYTCDRHPVSVAHVRANRRRPSGEWVTMHGYYENPAEDGWHFEPITQEIHRAEREYRSVQRIDDDFIDVVVPNKHVGIEELLKVVTK
jgi:hypothetical protein